MPSKPRFPIRLLARRQGNPRLNRGGAPHGYATLPVAADGFFGTRDAQGKRWHFFVEADRGTMALKRFTLKLKAYAAYWRAGKQKEKFGIELFRVLTVTSSAARLQNFIAAAEATDDLRAVKCMFLFTTEERLQLARPETIFEKIWTMPGEEELCSLGLVQKSQMKREVAR